MSKHDIKEAFLRSLCSPFDLIESGADRYFVDTPFIHDDGDALRILLKQKGQDWRLSDEGSTLMRLTYYIDPADLKKGNRKQIIDRVLLAHGIQRSGDELFLPIQGQNYGDALYDFAQALIHISDIEFLTRDKVKSTFREDFKHFFTSAVPRNQRRFKWHDATLDKQKKYIVDCRIETPGDPIFIFALSSDSQTKDATIALHQFDKWGMQFQSIALFENQESISRKALAQLTDICDKQFSSLEGNQAIITQKLERMMHQPLQ